MKKPPIYSVEFGRPVDAATLAEIYPSPLARLRTRTNVFADGSSEDIAAIIARSKAERAASAKKIPPAKSKRPRKPTAHIPLEQPIKKAIERALNASGRVLVSVNNGGAQKSEHKGKKRFVKYGLGKGSADLVGLLRSGRYFAFEVKRPGKKPTPHQRAWLAKIRQWGGFAAWGTSVGEAMAALARAEAGGSE